jgi:PEP-CTERM motif
VSRTLGAEPGTPITITGSPPILIALSSAATAFETASGGSVFASAGILDSAGNRVFTADLSEDFSAGTTFTIHGSSSDRVVINIPSTDGLGFNGSIVLDGGITPDHVLFNLVKGDFDTLTGGDTLMIDTDGNPTIGTFLVPNGNFIITDSMIFGRIFGGGAEFDSIIQTSDPTDPSFMTSIVAPPPFQTPEPTSLALLGAGLVALGIIRRHRRPVGLSS